MTVAFNGASEAPKLLCPSSHTASRLLTFPRQRRRDQHRGRRGLTDCAHLGARGAWPARPAQAQTIRLEVPREAILGFQDDTLTLCHRSKINARTLRVGAAINGVLVETHAGSAAVYLRTALEHRGQPFQVPLTYGAVASHAATLALSGTVVEREDGAPVSVFFVEDPKETATLAAAREYIDAYAQEAWATRQQKLVYAPSPTLTKTVAKVPVGVGERGYDLVASMLGSPSRSACRRSTACGGTVGIELQLDEEGARRFLADTARRGVPAAWRAPSPPRARRRPTPDAVPGGRTYIQARRAPLPAESAPRRRAL